MTRARFHIAGLVRLRYQIDQLAIENGLAVRCDRCAGAIYPDRIHICPEIIDVQAEDVPPDRPALPARIDP